MADRVDFFNEDSEMFENILDQEDKEMKNHIKVVNDNVEITNEQVSDNVISLQNFPEELIAEIFLHVPGYHLLVSCSLVCQQWYNVIQSQRLWKRKCLVNHGYTETMMKAMTRDDYRTLYIKNPYNRNLIRNSQALQGFKHWYVKAEGEFRIETKQIGRHRDPRISKFTGRPIQCWIPTYRSHTKVQVIDLIERGCTVEMLDHVRPNIVISDWYTGQYKMIIQLLHTLEDKQPLYQHKVRVRKPLSGRLNCIQHTISDYEQGVRYISFRHGGRQYVKQNSYDDNCTKITLSTVKLDLSYTAGSWDLSSMEDIT